MKLLYYSIFLVLFSPFALGQEINVKATMSGIKHEVEKGNYDTALSLIKPLREKFPENEEIKVYTGRIYSWKKDFKKAVEILEPMAARINPSADALLAIINTYYWSEQFETCISYCDRYLVTNPYNLDITIIKINCLTSLNRDKEASLVLERILVTDKNAEAIELLRTRIYKKAKNTIAASYLNISTYNPGQSPLHYGYVEYLRKFSKSAIIGRVNLGQVNNDTQLLFEVDYYKTFAKKDYLYINAGVSTGNTIFPATRAGLEYYFAPHKKFEYSIGLRYLNFETANITLITGQLGYIAGSSTLAYRPFYDTTNKLMSHVLSIQNTNEKEERILRLELQYGNVPYLYLYNSFTSPLKAYRLGLQYQHRFGNSFLVRPILLYEYEEYLPEQYRQRFNAQVIITKRF